MYRENTLDLDACKFYTNSDYKYGKTKCLEIIAVANVLDYYKVYRFVDFAKIEAEYLKINKNNFNKAYNTIKKIAADQNVVCKVKKHYIKSFNKIVKNIDAGFPLLLKYRDLKYGEGFSVITGYLEDGEDRKIKMLTGRDTEYETYMPWEKDNINKICTICM